MAYPNISDFYWKAICNSMLIQYMCDYYVKRFTQVFWTSYRRERISIRHTMEKSSKRMKKAMFTFWQFVKKWTLPLQKQHTLTGTKNFLFVGQLWEKKTLLTGQMVLFESISLVSTNKLPPAGEKEQKLLLTFCISDCVLKRWKNVFGQGNFEDIGGKKGLPHRYHWMLTEAYCEFLQCHERVKRLRPKYSDHIFSIFISTNGMLILRYLCPQTSNSRYVGYCLRSKLASDLKQE